MSVSQPDPQDSKAKASGLKDLLVVIGIGLIACLVGVVSLGIGISSFSTYLDSGNWVECQGTLKHVELKKSERRRSSRRAGSKRRRSAPTFRVEAEYEFEFDGQTHTGTRVGLGAATSNRSFHAERYEMLKEMQEEGQPVPVLVNPDDPSETLLFREFPFFVLLSLPFGLVFSGLGLFIFIRGIPYVRNQEAS